MPDRVFRDRRDAGRALARLLERYRDRGDVLVLALPRGGVPVAFEVATPLGAIASGGVVVINDDIVRGLGIRPEVVQRIAEQESRELLRRERTYRDDRPPPDIAGKVVILVDDGLATGSSMLAAVNALRKLHPAQIVVAVPAAPESTCRELSALVDDLVCATTPSPFFAVGESYWDFTQTTDEEVLQLLRESWTVRPKPGPPEDRVGVAAVRAELQPMAGARQSRDTLIDLVGDAHLVLLGEASHGTHEFYAERARITQRLIEEKGFCAVAAEADWPDAYRVNRFVRGDSSDETAEEALRGFERFPTWMWRNAVVLDFVGWMRERNDRVGVLERDKAGFYGLDLYGLFRSIQEIIDYLDGVDPIAAERARERYACFDHFGGDAQKYAFAVAFGAGESCEREVVDQLVDMQQHVQEHAPRAGLIAEDELFHAEQSARTVRAAEEYYRTMLSGRVSSWNLRDSHMADTYSGTVTAADDWGGPAERKNVRSALPGSFEALFHEVGKESFAVPFRSASRSAEALRAARLERAIGIIYRPSTERESHYFRARLAEQFDVVIHIDDTRAVEPLERTARWERGEVHETFPQAV